MYQAQATARRVMSAPAIKTAEEAREWRRCAQSVAYFINNYCWTLDPGTFDPEKPFRLWGFQVSLLWEWVRNRRNLTLKPRQMGVSWLLAAYVLWLCTFFLHRNVCMVSINQSKAKRLLEKVKFLYARLPPYLRAGIVNGDETLGQIGTTALIEFGTGSRVESIPTTKEGPRGETLSLLILDEAAYVRWIEELWTAVEPSLSNVCQVLVTSTPNGVGDWFHTQVLKGQEDPEVWNFVKLDWRDHPFRTQKWYDGRVRKLGQSMVSQEYDCNFMASGRPYFVPTCLEDLTEAILQDQIARNPLSVQRNGQLVIFEGPKAGEAYFIGADTSEGDTRDGSAQAAVVRAASDGRQVAGFNAMIPIGAYGAMLKKLGRWYGQGDEALMGVEINNTGHAVLTWLIDHGYENLFTPTDPVTGKKADKPGVRTTTQAKNRMCGRMEASIRHGTAGIRDPRIVNQCWTFQHGGVCPAAREGRNDDNVLAWAISDEVWGVGLAPDDLLPR